MVEFFYMRNWFSHDYRLILNNAQSALDLSDNIELLD